MVILLTLPKITLFFSINLNQYLEPKYKDSATSQSIEMSKTFTGSILDHEIFLHDLKTLNREVIEKQVQEFKRILFEVADTYIETESSYDLVSFVVHELIKIFGSIKPTVEGLEDHVIDNRRRWRELKEWMGSPGESKTWRSFSEILLLQIEDLDNITVSSLLAIYKEIFNQVDIEIETLRKKSTLNLVFKDMNFHESRAAIKAGDYDAFLSIDEENGIATLVYARDATMINKKTALRQSNSICKSGFELSNGRRVGAGLKLIESEPSSE